MENAANSHDFNPIRFDLEIRIVLVEIQEMQPLDWRKGGGGREEGREQGGFFPGITAPSPETPTLPSDWWGAAGWMTSRRTVISEQNPAPIPQRIWQRILKKNRQQNPSRP